MPRINPTLPEDALEGAFRRILIPQSPSLLINNKAFQKMITDGIDVSYRQKDGTIKYTQAKVFDFEELENPTIVIIKDRNDLDDQLFTTFAKSMRVKVINTH